MPRRTPYPLEWRVPGCTPEQLSTRYNNYITKLTNTATGKEFEWNVSTKNFYRTLSKELGIKKYLYKIDEVRTLLTEVRTISEEDIQQEINELLLEFHIKYLAKKQRVRFTWYILGNLSRRLAERIAKVIREEKADKFYPVFSEETWMEEPITFSMNLGWTTIKSKEGLFKLLTTFQKYLLFLRYNRNMTIPQISKFLGRNVKLIELDFMTVNKLIDGVKDVREED